MSGPTLAGTLAAARAEGLLPDDTGEPPLPAERPWPVVLLTALGAWFAAVPLCFFFGLLLGDAVLSGGGLYVVGIACTVGAVTVCRARRLPLFVEQLAIPALGVGGGMLAFGLYQDLTDPIASAAMAAVALAVAAAVPQPWLRACLGAAAATFAGCIGVTVQHGAALGATLHALLAVWLVAVAGQHRLPAAAAAWLEAVAAGWLVATLVGIVAWSGRTYLVGGGPMAWFEGLADAAGVGQRALSCVAAAGGAALLLRRWPSVRRPALAVAAAVLAGLAAVMAALGAPLLAAAACAVTGRWRLLGVAATAVAWVVGAFYYQLAWPLADKALLLLAAGVVLAAAAWQLASPRVAPAPADRDEPAPRRSGWPIPLAVAACLVVVNLGIREKEALIADGRVVLVPLAPVDPRSLVQGDFMRLDFLLPPLPEAGGPGAPAPAVVMQLDARGVASPRRVEPAGGPATPRAPDEVALVMVAKGGRWLLVTDAWFFAEGQGDRFAAAKYGEFRVTPDGRALLVGMRDAGLVPIAP